ncbi:hypothetical protein [Burkholderia pseudomallei]|uniref:hypothetical protein n=1 Tax=Burkholderia pseudomallei TaxID=28450 RepID=UPI0018E36A1C|nr:hypothetical protein [Burkholderia pseudomallei]
MIQAFRFPVCFAGQAEAAKGGTRTSRSIQVMRKLGPVADAMTTETRRRRSDDVSALEEDAK